jgi:hypothetical protein
MKQKAPARRRGFFILPFSLVCNVIGQPLPFSRSLFKRRVIFSLRTTSKKKRAARDAGDSRSPTASCEKQKTQERCRTARCRPIRRPARGVLGLLRRNPGGLTWPSFWERPLYPPLAGATPAAPCLGHASARPVPPCDARSARRAPCGLGRHAGLRTPHGHRSPPARMHACRTCPSWAGTLEEEYKPIAIQRQ